MIENKLINFVLFCLLIGTNSLKSNHLNLDFYMNEIEMIELDSIQWDEYGTRYQLIQSNPGSYNWLFLPGGAGADSCYFLPLIKFLQLPGKSWIIDFPSNGTNIQTGQEEYPFDQWEACLLSLVKKFKKPILIGHSFGAMFPLLFPELENLLTGFIIIGASPKIDLEENLKMIRERNINFRSEAGEEFRKNPNNETLKKALLERLACHFPPATLSLGQIFFETLPFNVYAMLWWIKKISIGYSAQWIPNKVPTLIMGGTEDCIDPISLFVNDSRFQRNNIKVIVIKDAGHFPWFEKKEIIKESIKQFIQEHFSFAFN